MPRISEICPYRICSYPCGFFKLYDPTWLHCEQPLRGVFCLVFKVSLIDSQVHRVTCIEYHTINLQICQILMHTALGPTLHFVSNDWNVWWAITRISLCQSDELRSRKRCQTPLDDSKFIHYAQSMQIRFKADLSLSYLAFCTSKLMGFQIGYWFFSKYLTVGSYQAIDQFNLSQLESGANPL